MRRQGEGHRANFVQDLALPCISLNGQMLKADDVMRLVLSCYTSKVGFRILMDRGIATHLSSIWRCDCIPSMGWRV